MTEITAVQCEDVTLKMIDEDVFVSGSIIQKNPELYMSSFFNKLHDYILERKLKFINVNITQLKFLNSSGIKIIVDWLVKVSNLPDENRYIINFICNKHSLWQDSSITTLKIIDDTIIRKIDI